jgi:hypothetical protein
MYGIYKKFSIQQGIQKFGHNFVKFQKFFTKKHTFVLQKERESGKIKKIVFVRSLLGWAGS